MSPTRTPAVHIEDRGYQFADGVYEVCEVARGFIVDMTRHLDRLNRSLTELRSPGRWRAAVCRSSCAKWCGRNHVTNGLVYVQVTRGVASRDSVFPSADTQAGAGGHRQAKADPAAGAKRAETGIEGHHRAGKPLGPRRHQDRRPAAQCTGQAEGQGGRRAGSLVRRPRRQRQGRRGSPTPGSSPGTACWSPGRPNTASCAASPARRMFEVAARLGLKIEERGFTVAEAKAAREAFISRQRRSPCRSWPSTAIRSPMAIPAR